MIVLQNDADVGWYVNNLACNAGERSGLLISKMVFARGVFSMHARHALHALPIAIQPKKINNNIFEEISKTIFSIFI